jgi:hypothetical protein
LAVLLVAKLLVVPTLAMVEAGKTMTLATFMVLLVVKAL